MKIVKQIRDVHEQSEEIYRRLALEVKEVLKPRVEENGWFFTSRIKALESFALKIETGRVAVPSKMEDFLGCTIVVPTLGQMEEAEHLVTSLYTLVQRRPAENAITHKSSSSFAFDDLRLYVSQRASNSGRGADLVGLPFEVQVKTVLQHAWSVATHDLIYKCDSVSWSRERIAYQIKAMLEHAEVAIAEANRLADAPAVAKKDSRTASVLTIIEELERTWSKDRLPHDSKRLAESVYEVLRACDLDASKYGEILEAEKRRVGLLPADLSPYAFTIQALANSRTAEFQRKFNRGHIRTTVAIHRGMELPDWMREGHPRIIDLG